MAGSMKDALGDTYYGSHYPDAPGYKKPGTSKAAAAAVARGKLSARKAAILKVIASVGGGLTADEAATLAGEDVLYARPRVTELGAAELLIDTGTTRKNTSGLSATVWRASNV